MSDPSTSPRQCADLLLSTVPLLMRTLSGCLRHEQAAGEEGPSLGQLHLLGMLGTGSFSLRQLATHHRVTPSTMSRAVDILVQRGWVSRHQDPRDRRQIAVELTSEGRAAQAARIGALCERLADLLSQLDGDERAHLRAALAALARVVDASGSGAITRREASLAAAPSTESGTR